VTLTGFETKSGNNDSGGWTLYLFKDAGGNKYQTFEDDLGLAAAGLIGKSVEVEYEVQERDLPAKGDRPATTVRNNVLKSVKEVDNGGPGQMQSVNAAQVNSRSYDDERQLRIMRQSALDRAINTVAAGIAEVSGFRDLFEIADEFILYFEAGISAFTPEEVVTY